MNALRAIAASLLAVSVMLTPTGTAASDFSNMGHPALIRSFLLPLKEHRAIRCLSRWTEHGEREPLSPLAEALESRIATLIGFPNLVRNSLRFERQVDKPMLVELPNEFGGDAGQGDATLEAQSDGTAETMPVECALLAATYRQSGLEAALAMIGPAPTGPVALPPAGTCLALLKSHGQIDAGAMQRMLSEVRQAHEALLPTVDRDRILAEVEAFRADTEESIALPDWSSAVERRDMIEILCLSSLVDLSSRLHPEMVRELENPHRELRLFRFGDRMLDDLDVEIAAHPEWLADPVRRATFGLFELPPTPLTE